MKYIGGLIGLGSAYTTALWIEYQTALLLGAGCFLFGLGSALALLGIALRRAPEGKERFDGFHVNRRDRRPSLLRYIRSLNQLGRDNEMQFRSADLFG